MGEAAAATEDMIAARAEQDEAEWQLAFEAHAVFLTECRRPSQITLCAFTGGVERWLIVRFNLSQSPLTFVQQVRDAVPGMTQPGSDGRGSVMFFGAVVGFVINYSPKKATRFDLRGDALAILPIAYRLKN